MNQIEFIFLQIPNGGNVILDAAQKVGKGDGSGYTFAVLVLSFMLLMALAGIGALYRANQKSKDNYIKLAEKSIQAISEVNLKLDSGNGVELEKKLDNLKDYVVVKLNEFQSELRNVVRP